jgi:biopolymer transport protein ExbD
MIRIPKIGIALLTLVVLAAFTVPAFAVEAKGTVKTVTPDKHQFVFTDKNAKDWTFDVEKDAKIFVNDKEGKLADLQAGDEVTVTYEKKNDKLMASEIRCKRK